MENRGFWRLEGVSDVSLERELLELLTNGHRTEARIVAHIAEVERRKLFLKEGFSSLYKYCQQRLGLSEYESWHRMTAARLARRYPLVFGLIEQREIHISALCALRKFLTWDNHRELLREASRKTKQQVEALLAARFPGAKLHDSVRRLPVRRIVASVAVPRLTNSRAPVAASADAAPLLGGNSSRPSVRAADAGTGEPLRDAGYTDVVNPTTGEVTTVRTLPESSAGGNGAGPAVVPDRGAPTNDAIQLPRYRVQFDASSALKAKMDLARALSSHANPKGDLETIFERALDLYVEHLQKRRFGKVDRPRAAEKPSRQEHGEIHESEDRPAAGATAEAMSAKRAHISHQTRREVADRDGLRCAYVSPAGRRCCEQSFLQIHHQDPWARSKNDLPSNLRIYCAAHNRFQAEQDFGEQHIARSVREAQARRESANIADRRSDPSIEPASTLLAAQQVEVK